MIRRPTAALPWLVAATVALGTCAASPEPRLETLGSIEDLRAAFSADEGVPRLVLLLSPT